jgi:serine/threonine-protein kinase HipA
LSCWKNWQCNTATIWATPTSRRTFLAVTRFDRSPAGRIQVDDFGQVLGVAPEEKYSRSYLEVAAVMMATASLGEPAVHELLRRITVNEWLSNPDML